MPMAQFKLKLMIIKNNLWKICC